MAEICASNSIVTLLASCLDLFRLLDVGCRIRMGLALAIGFASRDGGFVYEKNIN